MFVQVIEGRVADRDGVRRLMDRWDAELRPGAVGFLGSTSGVTADGRFIAVVRFESIDAGRSNARRAEQGTWWAEMEKCFSEAPSFHDAEDVETIFDGGSDRAGFVQVMRGRATDPAVVRGMEERLGDVLRSHRPEVLGGLRAWHSERDYTEVIYFTSEADARKGEAKERPAEAKSMMDEWRAAAGDITFYDLSEPVLRGA